MQINHHSSHCPSPPRVLLLLLLWLQVQSWCFSSVFIKHPRKIPHIHWAQRFRNWRGKEQRWRKTILLSGSKNNQVQKSKGKKQNEGRCKNAIGIEGETLVGESLKKVSCWHCMGLPGTFSLLNHAIIYGFSWLASYHLQRNTVSLCLWHQRPPWFSTMTFDYMAI